MFSTFVHKSAILGLFPFFSFLRCPIYSKSLLNVGQCVSCLIPLFDRACKNTHCSVLLVQRMTELLP